MEFLNLHLDETFYRPFIDKAKGIREYNVGVRAGIHGIHHRICWKCT